MYVIEVVDVAILLFRLFIKPPQIQFGSDKFNSDGSICTTLDEL